MQNRTARAVPLLFHLSAKHMLSNEQIQQLRPKLLSIQVISGFLMLGVLAFAGLMVMIVDWDDLNDRVKMLTLIAAATGVLILVLSIFIPNAFSSDVRPSGDSESDQSTAATAIANMLVTENLIRFALLESAIFLNLVVFFLEPHLVSLAVAGFGLLLMLAFFPRQSRMISVIEERIR